MRINEYKASYGEVRSDPKDIKAFLESNGFKWKFNKTLDKSFKYVNIRNDDNGKRFWFTQVQPAKKGVDLLKFVPINRYVRDKIRHLSKITTQPVAPQHDEMSSYFMKKSTKPVAEPKPQPQQKNLVQNGRAKVGNAVEDLISTILNLK